MKLIRRNSFNHPPPPAACQCVWIFLGFIFGYIFCLISSPSLDQPSETTINDPISIKKPKLDIPAWSGDVRSLVFRAMAPTPINHPGSIGEVSKVLKQRLITGRDTGMKSLVHLSMVDFGDGGYGGSEVLGFPSHEHGEGFHEVFVVTDGCGVMELNGVSTGPLVPGVAVHIPPGITHTGKALPHAQGKSFKMMYFALMIE